MYIIAEIGVNHDGDLSKAIELTHAAAHAGADAIKTQLFKASSLVSVGTPCAPYQATSGTAGQGQLEMLSHLELSPESMLRLKEECDQLGKHFICTPYDPPALDFLVEHSAVDAIKIASADLTNRPLLDAAAKHTLPVILSTGMSSAMEIGEAISIFRHEEEVGASTAGLRLAPLTLLHCTSNYPAPTEDLNMAAITTMRDQFGKPVGYSDHSQGHLAAIMAVALGAVVFEKHLTLDRAGVGPDHAASADPADFAKTVAVIRDAETARGNGVKRLMPSEVENRNVMRQSLFAARRIQVGHVFDENDIRVARPLDGDSPMNLSSWIGTMATKNFNAGEPLLPESRAPFRTVPE